MQTDSFGNHLPPAVFLSIDATPEQRFHASTINTFNLAASVAMATGKIVIYDKATKTATVEEPNGDTSIISHG